MDYMDCYNEIGLGNVNGVFSKIKDAAGKFTNWVGADTSPLFSRVDDVAARAAASLTEGVKVATGKQSISQAAANIIRTEIVNGQKVGVDINGNYVSLPPDPNIQAEQKGLKTETVIIWSGAAVAICSIIYLISQSGSKSK
jgi:hypothetical protein